MKDRAKPFDRKHRRYWLTTAGGMVLIMAINLALGFGVMQCKAPAQPTPDYHDIPPVVLPPDAGVDAAEAVDAGGLDAGGRDATVDAGSVPHHVER